MKNVLTDAVSRLTHSSLAETIAEGAQHALETLEKHAPEPLAGPMHALTEKGAGLRHHDENAAENKPAEATTDQHKSAALTPSPQQPSPSRQPSPLPTQPSHGHSGPHVDPSEAPPKVKRGQKH